MNERPESAPGEPDPGRVRQRAHELNPEEVAAGSDDPQAQAEAILADSDERTEHPERTRRASQQTPD
jgi:hypothetical protein